MVMGLSGVWVDHSIFTRKRLGGISSNFACAFIALLINHYQSVNWVAILVWDIFAFLASDFVDLAAKRTLIWATSNENQIT